MGERGTVLVSFPSVAALTAAAMWHKGHWGSIQHAVLSSTNINQVESRHFKKDKNTPFQKTEAFKNSNYTRKHKALTNRYPLESNATSVQ